jgi:hypothetical protein
MSKAGGVARAILMWSYERGTLQYDIICGLILAFIFFVPRSCFLKKSDAVSLSAPAGISATHDSAGGSLRQGN